MKDKQRQRGLKMLDVGYWTSYIDQQPIYHANFNLIYFEAGSNLLTFVELLIETEVIGKPASL